MEIIASSHMDMEDVVLNPDPRVCCSVICFYVYGFESLWKFMVQHLIGETLGVCGTTVSGCTALFGCLLCYIICWGALAWSIDGSGCTVLLVRALVWIAYWLVSGVVCRSMLAVRPSIRPGGRFDFWLWGSEASSSNSGSNFRFG